MADKGKYCCFNCPSGDFEEKQLSDACPKCGMEYGFPLTVPPTEIGDFKVVSALGRGFYGATYVAERKGMLRTKRVLKVIPCAVYTFFKKDFQKESVVHAEAAAGAEHIVGINDAFDADVSFGETVLPCHVAELDYLDGSLLQDYLSGKLALKASSVAQIAADLLRIREELERRKINHNDFHAGNIIIESLTRQRRREGAMEPSVRAVAIDLGSVAEDRRSGGQYKSDLHWIGFHIDLMSTILMRGEASVTDLDARLALELRLLAQNISAKIENQRVPTSDELINKIEEAYFRTGEPWRPWRKPFSLRKFGDSYNAQTLEAWNVPQLLVDPDDEWQKSIGSPGPLVVTGMRGCGKTMLLRALQFHARAVRRKGESEGDVVARIRTDGFVGFFVSASTLLKVGNSTTSDSANMFARLAVAYSLEAARALAHLQDLDGSAVTARSASLICDALDSVLGGNIGLNEVTTIQQAERILVDLLIQTCDSESHTKMAAHPSQAFLRLAESIRSCAPIWNDAQILFLLDDVSTRYMTPDMIQETLSAVIFQNPICAFKLTSETQAIFLTLKSPGGVEPAAHARDFQTFDLGAEVHKRLKQRGGKQFLADILQQRARYFSAHPNHVTPAAILGDCPLSDIAETISNSRPNSRNRKSVYHGLSALRAVCVGDLGTAITIYENILKRANGHYPVPSQAQSDAFQDYCSTLLYLLDRRGGKLKSAAKAFASASHQLLMESAAKKEDRGLRQYTNIYVRITAGDQEEQGKKLRELVDAGVFVFQGGAPRTKTKDSDPVQQFKLTFRKIYGLADFIGLAERDRFELSGEDLELWLNEPDKGAEILMRNLKSDGSSDEEDYCEEEFLDELTGTTSLPDRSSSPQAELDLFSGSIEKNAEFSRGLRLPEFRQLAARSDEESQVDVLYLALGFEERSLSSARRSLDFFKPKRVIAVGYPEKGKSDEILAAVSSFGSSVDSISYEDLISRVSIVDAERVAVDITGLTKAAIFRLTTEILRMNRSVRIGYTEAEEYYPLEDDLRAVLDAQSSKDYDTLLSRLKCVLTGEEGPYSLEVLQSLVTDRTRMTALFAMGSAKHERLIHLVDQRDYDVIKVLVDNSKSARATVARLAAEVAVRGAEAGSIEECNIGEPVEVLNAMEQVFQKCYLEGGLNFEIGLTGDKLETVAAAAFCATVHVNSVFYVKPSEFDPARFSRGTAGSRYFTVTI